MRDVTICKTNTHNLQRDTAMKGVRPSVFFAEEQRRGESCNGSVDLETKQIRSDPLRISEDLRKQLITSLPWIKPQGTYQAFADMVIHYGH